MAKLIDHGCLRPLLKLQSDNYPTSRTEVRQCFPDIVPLLNVLSFIDNLESNEQTLKDTLLKGDVTLIERLFNELSEVACWVEIQVRSFANNAIKMRT